MIFLDSDEEWLLARDRSEMVRILLARLDWEDVDLQELAGICLGCEPLDVVVVEE